MQCKVSLVIGDTTFHALWRFNSIAHQLTVCLWLTGNRVQSNLVKCRPGSSGVQVTGQVGRDARAAMHNNEAMLQSCPELGWAGLHLFRRGWFRQVRNGLGWARPG